MDSENFSKYFPPELQRIVLSFLDRDEAINLWEISRDFRPILSTIIAENPDEYVDFEIVQIRNRKGDSQSVVGWLPGDIKHSVELHVDVNNQLSVQLYYNGKKVSQIYSFSCKTIYYHSGGLHILIDKPSHWLTFYSSGIAFDETPVSSLQFKQKITSLALNMS